MIESTNKLLAGPDAVEAVTGDRPHYSTFFRWTQTGVKARDGRRIKLAFVKAGSRRLTSVDSVREFFSATTIDAVGEPIASCRTNRQRETNVRRAEEELAKAGI